MVAMIESHTYSSSYIHKRTLYAYNHSLTYDIMLSYMHKTRSCIEMTSIKQFIYK